VVVGAEPPVIRGVEVEARPWRAASEAQDLSDVDVGIMPLPDDDWSRGKCGLKALQFMALGIPTVVSPVGVNLQIVRHGENGLVAGSERDWVEKLSGLLKNAEHRHRLGARARHTVVEHYSARRRACA
jgi:glycosyltransferase involved in cell wall biosynthesis